MDKDNIKAYVNKALIKTYIGEALVKADDNFVNEYSVNIKAYFAEAIIKAYIGKAICDISINGKSININTYIIINISTNVQDWRSERRHLFTWSHGVCRYECSSHR